MICPQKGHIFFQILKYTPKHIFLIIFPGFPFTSNYDFVIIGTVFVYLGGTA